MQDLPTDPIFFAALPADQKVTLVSPYWQILERNRDTKQGIMAFDN